MNTNTGKQFQNPNAKYSDPDTDSYKMKEGVIERQRKGTEE